MDKERKKKRNVTWLDTIIVYNTDCISDILDEKKEKKWGWKSESFVGKCFVSALPFSKFCRKIWWISKPPKNHRWHSVVNFTLNFLFFPFEASFSNSKLILFFCFQIMKKIQAYLKRVLPLISINYINTISFCDTVFHFAKPGIAWNDYHN